MSAMFHLLLLCFLFNLSSASYDFGQTSAAVIVGGAVYGDELGGGGGEADIRNDGELFGCLASDAPDAVAIPEFPSYVFMHSGAYMEDEQGIPYCI